MTLAVPSIVPAVKIAVRTVPVPLMAPRVPRVKAAVEKTGGASVKVKVMVAVALAFKTEADEVMVTLGAKVSMLMAGAKDAAVPAAPFALLV